MRYIITIINGNDRLCIYDTSSPVEELALIDPTLHLESDAAGSFEATVPQTNVAWGKRNETDYKIEKMFTKIKIEYANPVKKTIWTGRFLSVETDFKNRLSVYAEGAYSFLNDSLQIPHVFGISATSTNIAKTIVTYILDKHNEYRSADFQIQCGMIDIPDSSFVDNPFVLGYESSIESIERLREQYGGHMRIRYDGDIAYLDWFTTYDTSVSENDITKVKFGVNLLDFTKKLDGTGMANAIFPIGKTIYNSGNTAIGASIPLCVIDPQTGEIIYGPDKDYTEGLAWGNGFRIHINTENEQLDYVEEASYSATGVWDSHSEDLPDHDDQYKSLQVQPGEVYYVSSLEAYAGTTMWVITENRLGTNPAWVLSSKKADDNTDPTIPPSAIEFAKVTVPESQRGYPLYLNVCAFKATGIGLPHSEEQLNMAIHRTRVIPDNVTEPITLLGIADGVLDSTVSLLRFEPYDWAENYKSYYRLNSVTHTYDKINDSSAPVFVSDTFYKAQAKSYLDSNNIHIVPEAVSDGEYVYHYDPLNYSKTKTFTKSGYFVQDDALIQRYGRIEKILTSTDVVSPSELERMAAHYLYVDQMKEATVNVSALDLALLGNDMGDCPDILEPVRILSSVHGTNLIAPLQQRNIPFNDLSSQTYEIGYDKSEQISAMLKIGGIT